MSEHRVELYVTFTVNDSRDGGRWVANEVLRQVNMFGASLKGLGLTDDLEATPSTVDGIGWWEKRPTGKSEPATVADADAALASGLETYNDLDKAIERLRQLQSDVREEMKALSYFRNRHEESAS